MVYYNCDDIDPLKEMKMTKWKLLRVEKETESNCWHCGAALIYSCWIENEDTGQIMAVGQDCCSNFMSHKRLHDTIRDIDIEKKYYKTVKKLDKVVASYKNNNLRTPKQIANHVHCYLSLPAMQKHYPEYYDIIINS